MQASFVLDFTCTYKVPLLVSLLPMSRSAGRPLSIKMYLADPNKDVMIFCGVNVDSFEVLDVIIFEGRDVIIF